MVFSIFSSPLFLFSLVLFSFHSVNGQTNLTTFAGSQPSDSFGTTLTFLPATISNCADTSNTSCEGKWFPTADKSGFGTLGKGTTAVFKFQGPYAEFYGHKFELGAGGTYTVDSSSTPVSFTSKDTTKKDPSSEGLLFTVSNLDPSKEHSIEVTYDDQDFAESGSARKFLSIVNVLYQRGANDSSTGTNPTSTTSPSNVNAGKGGDALPTGALIGIVVGALVGVAILCFVLFLYWRRRRWHHRTAVHTYNETRQTAPFTVVSTAKAAVPYDAATESSGSQSRSSGLFNSHMTSNSTVVIDTGIGTGSGSMAYGYSKEREAAGAPPAYSPV